jgi:hypothetical protein
MKALPPSAAGRLEAAALGEMQRALSARAQILAIGRRAEVLGERVIVLKGGVAAVEGQPLDLLDVDVLARPGAAHVIAGILREQDYRSGNEPEDHRHLAQRTAPFSLPVEVHREVPEAADTAVLWERAVTLPNGPGLAKLAAADHLWYLLFHSVVMHPERRGRIRDLLLMGHAYRACSADDVFRDSCSLRGL